MPPEGRSHGIRSVVETTGTIYLPVFQESLLQGEGEKAPASVHKSQ